GQIAMSRDLRTSGKRGALRQVVDLPHQSRSGPYRLLAQLEAVVRRRPPVDEGQDLTALLIDPEVSRRALETAPFEVKEKAVHVVRVGVHWPPNGGADSHDTRRRHPAEKWHFLV